MKKRDLKRRIEELENACEWTYESAYAALTARSDALILQEAACAFAIGCLGETLPNGRVRKIRARYIPWKEGAHTREAFRTGYAKRVRREPKAKYWTPTGTRTERRELVALCGWPSLDWHELRCPGEPVASDEAEGVA